MFKLSEHCEFLTPACSSTTVDIFLVRRAILDALSSQLKNLHGTVVDVGCGYMPYKPLVLASPSRAERYIGIDLHENIYRSPDLEWDGSAIPLKEKSVDCALATEVFEHCPEPELVMRETLRVLKSGGLLFLTCAASEDGLTARSSHVFLPEGRSPLRSRAARAEHLAGSAERHPGRDRTATGRTPAGTVLHDCPVA